MPSATQPLTDADLDAVGGGRHLGDNLLASIRQMKAGQGNCCTRQSSPRASRRGCRHPSLSPCSGCRCEPCVGASRINAILQGPPRPFARSPNAILRCDASWPGREDGASDRVTHQTLCRGVRLASIKIAPGFPRALKDQVLVGSVGFVTNRHPCQRSASYRVYSTLLLREASIERAVAAFPEAETSYDRNIETLNALGQAGWQALWRQP